MEKTKEKRIRRLKRKRIWPSVIGLFVIVGFILVAIVGEFTTLFINILSRELMYGYRLSMKVAESYETIGEDNSRTPEQMVELYHDMMDELEAVCVYGAQGEILWSSSDMIPKKEEAVTAVLSPMGKEVAVDMVLSESVSLFTIDSNGDMEINEKLLAMTDFSNIYRDGNQLLADEDIWYLIPMNEHTVCVLCKLRIYGHDLQMAVLGMSFLVLVVVLFSLYYLWTLVSMVISQKRTTKIIYTDMITGGENWLAFIRKSTKRIRKVKRGRANKKLAVIHLRMKKYRSFCTCFGFIKGEELIERIYLLLKKQMRRGEVLAHHEKADFGMLLSCSGDEELILRLTTMLQKIDSSFPEIKLKFAIGVCYVEHFHDDVEDLYNNAVLARELCGEDKEPQIGFFNIEMSKQRLWEQKVEADMERALENREFQVYLQPKFSTGEETLGGAEALVRWIHPTEGFVPPNKFIPIFERNGFILKLDDYMLHEVARQQAEWIEQGWKVVPISVNVSHAHFTREDLAEHICEIVDQYHVPHNVIELELTESAFFDDKQVLLTTVRKLRDAGFSVSMDDFGAGYSSLNSLKELSIDVLKIDADFFRGADSLDRGMLIVSEVIDLAKKLNMKIVAEGIESREQVDFLTDQECDMIQGYYFAKPMPIEEFEKNYKKI